MQLLFIALFIISPLLGSDLAPDDGNGNRLGIYLPDNDAYSISEEHFGLLRDAGIRIIEVDHPSVLEQHDFSEFHVFLRSGPDFPVPYQLRGNRDQLSRSILDAFEEFPDRYQPRLVAISMFNYPFEDGTNFTSEAEVIADTLQNSTDLPVYFRSVHPETSLVPSNVQFVSNRVVSGSEAPGEPAFTHFIPHQQDYDSFVFLEELLNASLNQTESITFLPADWLARVLETYPDFVYVLERYQAGESVTIPLPQKESDRPDINWSIILLLAIWVSFVLHFKYQPVYAQSAGRYFTNHSFFVLDIQENRIRNALPGIYLLIQHAFLTGLFIVSTAELLLSDIGYQILQHHFSSLLLFQNTNVSLFVLGFFLALVLQFLSILWIHLPNKDMKNISQAINLYSWPLHINLFIVTLLVIFTQVGLAESLVVILSSIFVLVWFFSFNIAAFDATKFLDRFRFLYLFTTAGIHTILMAGVVWYIYYSPEIMEPLRFAILAP